jgi:hypothetical protein
MQTGGRRRVEWSARFAQSATGYAVTGCEDTRDVGSSSLRCSPVRQRVHSLCVRIREVRCPLLTTVPLRESDRHRTAHEQITGLEAEQLPDGPVTAVDASPPSPSCLSSPPAGV